MIWWVEFIVCMAVVLAAVAFGVGMSLLVIHGLTPWGLWLWEKIKNALMRLRRRDE